MNFGTGPGGRGCAPLLPDRNTLTMYRLAMARMASRSRVVDILYGLEVEGKS
jgi:hypothetical protein